MRGPVTAPIPSAATGRWKNSVNGRPSDFFHAPPIIIEDRPEGLVQIVSVAQERPAQDAFLHSTKLPERTVAPSVRDRDASLQPVRPDLVEGEPRGGPRFSDRLLRWSPDPTGGIWNATQETELPG